MFFQKLIETTFKKQLSELKLNRRQMNYASVIGNAKILNKFQLHEHISYNLLKINPSPSCFSERLFSCEWGQSGTPQARLHQHFQVLLLSTSSTPGLDTAH